MSHIVIVDSSPMMQFLGKTHELASTVTQLLTCAGLSEAAALRETFLGQAADVKAEGSSCADSSQLERPLCGCQHQPDEAGCHPAASTC